MLKYEIKKNFFNLSVLFFLVVCTFLEIYKINEFSEHNIPMTKKFGGSAYSETFKKYGGHITAEKVRYVTDFTLSARQLIQSGDYDAAKDTTEYITGDLYRDYSMFSIGFYIPMKYSYEYREYSDNIARKAYENVEFFSKIGNSYEVAKNKEIYDIYSGRYLSKLYDTDGYSNFLKYEFTCIPMCFMLIIGLAEIFVGERTVGMKDLLNTCSKGGGKVFFSKIAAGFTYTFFVFTWFTVVNLICFGAIYGFAGGEAPIYSLQEFKNIPLNCSVFGFTVITLLLRLVGLLTISAIIITISVCTARASICGVISAVAIALLLFSDNIGLKHIAQISPLRLIVSSKLFERYGAINVNGIPVPLHTSILLGNFFACVVLLTICGIIWTKVWKTIPNKLRKPFLHYERQGYNVF